MKEINDDMEERRYLENKKYIAIFFLITAVLIIPWLLYTAGIISKIVMALIVLPAGLLTLICCSVIKRRRS